LLGPAEKKKELKGERGKVRGREGEKKDEIGDPRLLGPSRISGPAGGKERGG